MRISIIGCEYVGTVTSVCFADFSHDIVLYDIDKEKLALLTWGESPIYEPSLEGMIRQETGLRQITENLRRFLQLKFDRVKRG